MNGQMLKGFRVGKGKTQTDYGNVIEKSTDSYAKKERGEVEFTLNEAMLIVVNSDMTFEQFNDIFFDGCLPFGKGGQV